jgi:hypothetical protein
MVLSRKISPNISKDIYSKLTTINVTVVNGVDTTLSPKRFHWR